MSEEVLNNTAVENEYGADQIQILEGLEAVRKRPGMYIGSTSSRGLHHLVYEIVDNAVDEALAGYCDTIEVTINPDNSITVIDNGRGIPVGINHKAGIAAVEVVFTILHAGGKFGGGGYKVSGGLHGVGASVVNALSDWLEVEICQEGKVYKQRYEKGHTCYPLKQIGTCDIEKTGTKVTFKPDATIFQETTVYDFDVLKTRLREMAFLTKGLRIILRDTRVEDDTHENAQIQTLLERAYEDRENEDSENMEVFPDDEKEREEEKEELNEIKYTFEEHEEFPNKELLSLEKEMLGIYISGHPLEKLRKQIEAQATINTLELKNIDEQMNTNINNEENGTIKQNTKLKYKDGQNVKYIGIISSIKKKYTKNNKLMAFVTVEDLYGTAEIIVFENAYIKSGKSLIEENIVEVNGRLSIREDDTTTIIANDIKDFGEKKVKILTLDITNANEEEKEKLRGAIKYFNGERNNINVQIKVGEEYKPCGQIYLTDEILNIFKDILPNEGVKISEN